MRRLDFISKAPNFSIFKEGANKTNLGGFLCVVYIIIILLLAIVYFYDYFTNDKYQFNYTLVKASLNSKSLDKNEEMSSIINTDKNYVAWLGKDNPDPFNPSNTMIKNKNFIIVDINKIDNPVIGNDDECVIKPFTEFKYKVNDLQIGVLYRCNLDDCTIRYEDKIHVTSYYLFLGYQGFSIEHQNPENPIQPLTSGDFWLNTVQFLENTNIAYLNWELIEYEEEQGIFAKTYNHMVGNSQTYYGGYYKSKETFTDDGHVKNIPETDMRIKDLNGNHFTLLLYLATYGNPREYERYSRKKISFLDVLADVSALASTVLDLMALAYGFLYEENYDNYKIIENILTKKMNIIINNQKIIKEDDEKDKIELKTDLIESKTSEENEKAGISIKENNQGEEKRNKENLDLPSPNFFDFLFNKLYFKCFGPSSKQNLIDSCNDIVAKYITIENILYNQMKLEYLWKDYKWNNPQNEIGQKDGLILTLKEK